MSQITDQTTFGEFRAGDVFADGRQIVSIDSVLPSRSDPSRQIVSYTVEETYLDAKGRPVRHTSSDNWADETWGTAVDRARFMHGLADHS